MIFSEWKSIRALCFSLKQSVMREQMACQAELKKLAMGKRKGIYLQFCENIPDSVTHILREQMETLVQQLPTVYVKDTEFDCKQMLVRYDSKTACKVSLYVSLFFSRCFQLKITGQLFVHRVFDENVELSRALAKVRYLGRHILLLTSSENVKIMLSHMEKKS